MKNKYMDSLSNRHPVWLAYAFIATKRAKIGLKPLRSYYFG